MLDKDMKDTINAFFNKLKYIEESRTATDALISSLNENRRGLTQRLKDSLKDYLFESIHVNIGYTEKKFIEFSIKFFDENERDRFIKNHSELNDYITEGLEPAEINILLDHGV